MCRCHGLAASFLNIVQSDRWVEARCQGRTGRRIGSYFFPDGNRAAQRTPEARNIDSVEVRRTGLVDEKRAAHRPRVGVCRRAKRGCQPRSPMQRTRASMGFEPKRPGGGGDEYFRRLSLSLAPGEMDGSRAWLGIGVSPSLGSAWLDVEGTIGQIDGQGATTPCMTSEEPLIRMRAGCYGDGPRSRAPNSVLAASAADVDMKSEKLTDGCHVGNSTRTVMGRNNWRRSI